MAASDVLDQAIEDENTTAQPVDEAAEAEIPAAEAQGLESADVSPGGGEGAGVSTGIDEELLETARAYGISTEGVAPKDIARHLATTFDRQIAQLGREARPQQLSQSPSQGPTQQPPTTSVLKGLDLDALIRENFPEQEIDPALRKGIHALASKLSEDSGQKYSALKEELSKSYDSRVAAIEHVLMQENERQATAMINGFFSSLGPEWEDKFGKGPVHRLSPVSPQLQKRREVVDTASAMKDYYFSRQQQPPSDEALLRRALNAVYADQQTTIAKKQIAQQLNKRQGAAASRPAAKNGKSLTEPRENAIKFSNDWDREHLADL